MMSITINNASSMHDGTIHGWRVVCVVCGVLCISTYADLYGFGLSLVEFFV